MNNLFKIYIIYCNIKRKESRSKNQVIFIPSKNKISNYKKCIQAKNKGSSNSRKFIENNLHITVSLNFVQFPWRFISFELWSILETVPTFIFLLLSQTISKLIMKAIHLLDTKRNKQILMEKGKHNFFRILYFDLFFL